MRVLTITMEVNDKEAENLLTRLSERGEVEISGDSGAQTATAAPTTPPAPTPPAEAELDANGVPWHEVFHAKSKGKNKNLTWKAARGLTDAQKDEAEAYEESFSSEPETPPVADTPTPPAPPAAPTPPVAAPTPPSVPVAPPAAAPVSFEELTAAFTEVIGRIGNAALMEKLGAIYAAAGTDSGGQSLQTNETHRAAVFAAIKAL